MRVQLMQVHTVSERTGLQPQVELITKLANNASQQPNNLTVFEELNKKLLLTVIKYLQN